MATDPQLEVRVVRTLAITPEQAFDAWLDPMKVRAWMLASGAMQHLERVEIDGRVSGRFSFVDIRETLPFDHTGTYLEIERPRRLVFTWEVAGYSAAPVTVSIDITPAPSGCVVTLAHTVTPEWEEFIEHTKKAWSDMLGGIEAVRMS